MKESDVVNTICRISDELYKITRDFEGIVVVSDTLYGYIKEHIEAYSDGYIYVLGGDLFKQSGRGRYHIVIITEDKLNEVQEYLKSKGKDNQKLHRYETQEKTL